MAPINFEDSVVLFTPGRACSGPLAVVLHEWSGGIETLDLAMQACPRRRPAQSPGCHTSFHYGVGGACNFHQYVDQANTAWGFGVTTPTCPEPVCPPDECASCTGITVAQYQTDFDGNPPTLPGWSAGPDGTVNCAVIHVAITGSLFSSVGQPFGCCPVDPKAYQCVLRALCEIFAEAGLTPSQNTLLVHCLELDCLDIDQLVTDLLAFDCEAVPVSPCINCPPIAGTLTVTDTATVDLTLALANLSADVNISADAGNIITAHADGLFATAVPDAPACSSELPFNSIVYGTGDAGGTPVWGRVQRPQLAVVDLPTGSNVDPASNNDVFTYSGVGAGAFALIAPAAGACAVRDLWIKDLSASALTISSAALIDGNATLVLATNEFAHLVWTGTTWLVI